MFNYRATRKDFEAVEEGIKIVWRPELDFIFKRKNLLKNIIVVSFDSSFIYLWTKLSIDHLDRLPCGLSDYYAYKIPHEIKLKDEWQSGWRVSLPDEAQNKFLPEKLRLSPYKIPIISGGLLTPFIKLQENKNIKNNPYITQESYLATIVHEFGHVYWDQHKLCWYSNKKENISILSVAKQLYEGKKKTRTPFYFPMAQGISELYAFCAEYVASQLFWKDHKQNLDAFIRREIEKLIKEEETKDLDREDSVLTPNKNPHNFAFVFGKILLSQYPQKWPQILTDKFLQFGLGGFGRGGFK